MGWGDVANRALPAASARAGIARVAWSVSLARISRRELKKDEFAAEVSKTYQFFQERRAFLTRYGAVAAVVVALALGGYWLYQNRKQHARADLSHAVRLLFADQPEAGMSFTDAKSRDAAAEKELSGVAQKYSRLEEGRLALYYLGVAEDRLGKTDAAIRDLRQVAGKNDDKIAPLARYAMAGIYAKSGKADEAEKLYRELAARPTESVPKATAELALADLLSSSQPAEARKILEELSKNTLSDPTGAQVAQRRLSEMKQ